MVSRSRLSAAVVLAACLFLPLFVFAGPGGFDFWWWMAANAVVLTAAAAVLDTHYTRRVKDDMSVAVPAKLLLGVLSAVLLYGIFSIGNELSAAFFSRAPGYISSVYDLKHGASVLRVSLIIGLLIGPGEELFWRAFLQEHLRDRIGSVRAVLLATFFYTIIHGSSMNPMLLVAAAVCGLFWGILYEWKRSPLINIVSHVVWDLSVFLLFPFR